MYHKINLCTTMLNNNVVIQAYQRLCLIFLTFKTKYTVSYKKNYLYPNNYLINHLKFENINFHQKGKRKNMRTEINKFYTLIIFHRIYIISRHHYNKNSTNTQNILILSKTFH